MEGGVEKEGSGYEKRNQELWGFPTEASMVCSISNSVITLRASWFFFGGKVDFAHFWGFGCIVKT